MTSPPMPTETSPTSGAASAEAVPDYAPVPRSALDTTFWVMESIRLDFGYGSQVHP